MPWRPSKSKSPCLPLELYRLIIEAVQSKSELYTLLFVSRTVRCEAERVLYRILVINDPDPDRRLQLLRHVINSHHIAILVRSLQIDRLPFHTADYHNDTLYWSTVQQALRAVKNLKELTIPRHLFHSLPPVCLLTGCAFRLRSLAVHSIEVLNQPALEAQTELEELEVSFVGVRQFSQQSFPRLSVLSTSTLPEALFPNARRTVTNLELTPGVLFRPDCLSFNMVKALSVHRYTSMLTPVSTALLTPFPSLRYLQYTFQHVYSFHDVVDEILEQKAALAHLEKLYFLWKPAVHPGVLDLSMLFSHLRSLQTIAVQFSNCGAGEDCAEWVRDVHGYKFVPSYPDGWKDRSWAEGMNESASE